MMQSLPPREAGSSISSLREATTGFMEKWTMTWADCGNGSWAAQGCESLTPAASTLGRKLKLMLQTGSLKTMFGLQKLFKIHFLINGQN